MTPILYPDLQNWASESGVRNLAVNLFLNECENDLRGDGLILPEHTDRALGGGATCQPWQRELMGNSPVAKRWLVRQGRWLPAGLASRAGGWGRPEGEERKASESPRAVAGARAAIAEPDQSCGLQMSE